MAETRSSRAAAESGSLPGAGDILGAPAKGLQDDRADRPAKVSPDAYDPPAASGIGRSPHPMLDERESPWEPIDAARKFIDRCDGSFERAREELRSLEHNPAVEFIERIGSVEAAIKTLDQVESIESN